MVSRRVSSSKEDLRTTRTHKSFGSLPDADEANFENSCSTDVAEDSENAMMNLIKAQWNEIR